jgi:hypothetical protein
LSVGDLDDSFTQLLGHQPSDKERQDLYRVRDALKLKSTDAVWTLLMVLQHYQTLYEQFPARIAAAARDVTKTVRATAEAETKAAQEMTKAALMAAVHEATVKSSARAAGAQRAKWVSAASGVICVSLLVVGWSAFGQGREKGRAVGEDVARKECAALVAASSWANTPEGQLAYAFAKSGGLGEVARCAGRGMVPRDGWCLVSSERGRPLARWPVPTGGVKNLGESP